MPIPDYQSIMLPLLKLLADQQEHSSRQAIDSLAAQFKLSEAERRELLPTGQQPFFNNRVGWAGTYMKKALLVESTRRGFFRITPRGLDLLKQNPTAINARFLDKFDEFRQFRTTKREGIREEKGAESGHEETPEEALESAYQNLRNTLANDLLQQI